MLWAFIFISYLFALFAIIGDIFRDTTLGGGWKAVWIFFPIVTALISLIARGRGMSERQVAAASHYRAAQDDDIRQIALRGGRGRFLLHGR